MSKLSKESKNCDYAFLLNQLYKKLHAIIDIETICKETGKALLDFFHTGTIFIAVYYPEKQSFSIPYYVSDENEVKIADFPEESGLTSLILKEKKPLIVQQNAHAFFVNHNTIVINKEREPKSWIGIPIIHDNEFLGVLSLQSYDYEDFFSEEDINTLISIANSIAQSIHTARDYAFMKRHAENSTLLVNMLNSLQMTMNDTQFFKIYTEKLCLLVPHSITAIYVRDTTSGNYVRTAEAVFASTSIFPEKLAIGQLEHSEHELFNNGTIDNSGTSPLAELLYPNNSNKHKLMAISLTSNNVLFGFAVIVRSCTDNDFTVWELDICNAFSKHTAILYNNILAFKEVHVAKTEAEEANKIKSQFLATISHELRTPLNSIINFAFLLLQEVEGPITPEQRELLSRIEVSGKHLLSLINDILDLAKIESGKMELYLEETNTDIIVKEMLGVTESLIQNKPIRLQYEAPESLPTIKADRVRLRQILLNLLSNAVKFTDRGTITMRIAEEDSFLIFSIEDTGIGISETEINRAFTEFVQLDTGYSRKAGGTGLGLPIAKRFVELHGGTITITSAKNKGTKVSFSIPIYRAG